jgi:peptidoglycan LD-endopeptidase LytH
MLENRVNSKRTLTKFKKIMLALVMLIAVGMLLPEYAVIPVQGATSKDWNPRSFWFEPWGASGVHKGIDIFGNTGTPVQAPVPGVLLYRGQLGAGGNVVAILGPKWRIHYFAHLQNASQAAFFVAQGSQIGAVGTTGNAIGKPPHLHYSVLSLLPIPWRYTSAEQGWKRMFFLDPGEILVPH